MSYLDQPIKEKLKTKLAKLLAPGEEIILATGIGRRYIQAKLIGSVLTIPLVIGIVGLFKVLYLVNAISYLLTNRRVIIKKGIYSIKLVSIPYDKITHIAIYQTAMERYGLNSGKVSIFTAGYDQREIILEHVESPIEFKNILEDLMIKERQLYPDRPSFPDEPEEIEISDGDILHPINLK
ncbi:PH domain-containing protein [Candidatus Daviesbacteria bacterium]|nr:PH domain-containing protein [Candidatus Daviesbacteria bacterium]